MNRHCWPLQTDLYELTMAYGYWKLGMHEREAVFHLFYRKQPYEGGFAVCCGLDSVIRILDGFHFGSDDLTYLAGLKNAADQPLFEPAFLDYLGKLRLTYDIDAIPEGRFVFPHEPLIRTQGPLLHIQILETLLLQLMNFGTLIATKAARLRVAAPQDELVEFGLRRAQGLDGGLTGSRASYVGGCDSTSNVLAGKEFGIPVKGTHAHSWVMAFDSELESFEAYAQAMPDNCVLLVDTYDTLQGVKHAIQIGLALKQQGKQLLGIRLDSGDLLSLSQSARRMLDEAGLVDAKIVASNELDEWKILDLKRQGAPIVVWGVGTRLATGHPEGALGGVYKLGMIRRPDGSWVMKLKTAEEVEKMSEPGRLQVRRFYDKGGKPVGDVIYNSFEELGDKVEAEQAGNRKTFTGKSEDLLVPIYRDGRRVYQPPPIEQTRGSTMKELDRFPQEIISLEQPSSYFVGTEKDLLEWKRKLAKGTKI